MCKVLQTTKISMFVRFFIVAALAAFCVALETIEEKYTQRFDHINVDDILKSERLVNNYVKCMLNKGPCTTEAIEAKKHMPDAMQTECSKCSELQRLAGAKIFHYMINHRPDTFAEIEKLYDPTGIYRAKYYEKAREYELFLRDKEAKGKPLFDDVEDLYKMSRTTPASPLKTNK